MMLFSRLVLITFLSLIFIFPVFGNSTDSIRAGQIIPKEVSVSLLLLDILKIDDVNKRMSVDFALRMNWQDTALLEKKGEISLVDNSEVWRPEIQFLNSISLEPKVRDVLNVQEGGRVFYGQRYVGEVSLSADFSKFPFDDHEFKIKAVGVNLDSFTFKINETLHNQVPPMTQAEWIVRDLSLAIEPFNSQARIFPGFEFKMQFKRKVQFYIWKTIIPLTLVVFMSWTVFWVHPKHLEAQVAITVTAMLTLVTFQFVLSNILPPLSYLTKMDIFIIGANLLVFLALLETVVSGYFYDKGKLAIAEKVDRWSRFIFPVLLTSILMAAFLW